MIKIYSTSWCGPCASAKRLLKDYNIDFEEINIEDICMSREELFKITGGMTVPQIVINNQCIGGFDDLFNLSQSGELQKLIK